MKVSVLIACYGDEKWHRLALRRAFPSTEQQGAHEVIVEYEPDGTIASCRNQAVHQASGDLLVFLDADDELAPGYVSAISAAARHNHLLTPMVSYVHGRKPQLPKFWPEIPLDQGNWLVIGTAVPRDLFLEVGGFEENIHGFEDWSLFARCWKAGAEITKVPEAVYIAHVSGGSRNRKMGRRTCLYWHQRIGHNVFPEKYEAPTADEDHAMSLSTKTLRFC